MHTAQWELRQKSDSQDALFYYKLYPSNFVQKWKLKNSEKCSILINCVTRENIRTHSAAGGSKLPVSDARKSHTKRASPKLTRDLESGMKITLLTDSLWPMNTFNHTI